MKIFHGSIRKKLIILVLLATTPVFLVLFGAELINKREAVKAVKTDTVTFLSGFAEIQRRITESTHTLLRTVASMPVIRNLSIKESRIILETLLQTNPIYTNVILVNLNGDVVAAGRNHERAINLNFADRKQFKDAITGKSFAAGEFTVGKSSKKAIFPFGMAVLDREGEPCGALIIGVNLNYYGELFERGEYPGNPFIGIADYKGLRLFRYPISQKTEIGVPIKKEVFQAASTSRLEGSIVAMASDGKERVIIFDSLVIDNGTDPYMYMFMGFDHALITERAHLVFLRLVFASCLSLSFALAIAWFIGGQKIAETVEELIEATRNFGKGKSNVTSKIDYSDGEIGVLAESYDNMVLTIKKQEGELRESEQRFREIIEDVSNIAVQGYDENRRITFWNSASEKLYGYTTQEAMGKKLEAFIIPAAMQEEVILLHNRWLKEGLKIPSGELNLIDKEGNDVTVFSSHIMRETPLGKEMFCIDVDMTPMQRAEEEKKKLLEHLSHTQKMEAVGQLAGGIAHDFNNMLGGIIGACEMLALHLPDDPKTQKFFHIIQQSAGRAADLTSKLLTLSRDSKKNSTAIDIHTIIDETVVLLENTLDRRIRLEVHLDAQNCVIVGDSSQLHNMFLNLGLNAAQSMPKGGVLSISSQVIHLDSAYCDVLSLPLSPGNYLEIEVQDTGCGIPPEHLTKIFDPFFTTKSQNKGTGLGLATVYGTIKQHNGSIRVYSELEVGTTFNILLPLTAEKNAPLLNCEVPVKGEGTILLVDDEEIMRETGKAILEDLGYTVILAKDGEAAVNIYKRMMVEIDLVVLDMIMPVMNGKDCFTFLQQRDPNVCVILSSGFTRNEDLTEMKKLGLKSFVRKPYGRVSLSKAVYEAINGSL